MKKLFLASITLVALNAGGSALAADMRVKAPPPIIKPACSNFSGAFVNGHVGWGRYEYGWNDRDAWAVDIDEDLPGSIETRKSGFAGGVGVGFNWQPSCVLFGVDLDYDWASITAQKLHTDDSPAPEGDTLDVASRLRAFGTLRVRTGLVVESMLLYVTGGLAWGRFNRTWTLFSENAGRAETFSPSSTRWGAVVGFGSEWDWGDGWSIRAEALYLMFEKAENNFFSTLAEQLPRNFESRDDLWNVRIGLSYRFGGFGKYPVAARY